MVHKGVSQSQNITVTVSAPRPKKTVRNSRKRIRVGFASRQEADEHSLEVSVQAWNPLIQGCDCLLRSTAEAMESEKKGGGLGYISDLLYGSSAKSSLPHARGFSAFMNWLDVHPAKSAAQSTEGMLLLSIHYLQHFNSEARLSKKGVQSTNGVAKRTVLHRAVADIALANEL